MIMGSLTDKCREATGANVVLNNCDGGFSEEITFQRLTQIVNGLTSYTTYPVIQSKFKSKTVPIRSTAALRNNQEYRNAEKMVSGSVYCDICKMDSHPTLTCYTYIKDSNARVRFAAKKDATQKLCSIRGYGIHDSANCTTINACIQRRLHYNQSSQHRSYSSPRVNDRYYLNRHAESDRSYEHAR